MELNNEQLKKINGGTSGWITLGIIGGLFFIVGILQGIVHPDSCK